MNVAAFAVLLVFAAGSAHGATLVARPVVDGFSNPLYATAPAGDSRLFVMEQGGAIRILDPATGAVRSTPFLTVRGILAGGEQGLLGLAFHPAYASNGTFFVYVTRSPDGATEVRRYRVSADPNVADPASGQVVLSFAQPYANHNGGWIGFGPDGYLYIASGDGGAGNDPGNRAQNPSVLLGKILRIDVNQTRGSVLYGIPPTNPFAGGGGAAEVWDLGLRNPWRCSFDRETGDFWIADVGQNAFEEVNVHPASQPGGRNFGWRVFEGNARNTADPVPPGAVGPVHVYGHSVGQSITGGYVLRGRQAGAFVGRYVFGDFVSGRVWSFRPVDGRATDLREHTATLTATGGINSLASFAEDAAGRVYAISRAGRIYRLEAATGAAPTVRVQGGTRRRTTAPSLLLRGTASGGDVARVTIRPARGRPITAEGGALWRARVPLRPGDNRMVVTAVSSEGLSSRPVVVVVQRTR